MNQPSLSVVIPVRNDPFNLRACLEALYASAESDFEVIVVDDASDGEGGAIAQVVEQVHEATKDAKVPPRVLRLSQQCGPAAARNRGAEEASADYLLFLDADVEVRTDTLSEIRSGFDEETELAALFGSYDRSPSGQNLLSQYRNILHHYTHQNSSERAFTFWSGCGAIRREVFLENGGFEDRFHHPSIEDIELGQRLTQRGALIRLRRSVLVRHRKVWRFFSMMHCDLLDRGIPWTRELLRLGHIPADLNMRYSDRVLTFLALILTILLTVAVVLEPLWLLAPFWIALALVVADRASSPGSGLSQTRWVAPQNCFRSRESWPAGASHCDTFDLALGGGSLGCLWPGVVSSERLLSDSL